jgi:hypothetical protein
MEVANAGAAETISEYQALETAHATPIILAAPRQKPTFPHLNLTFTISRMATRRLRDCLSEA